MSRSFFRAPLLAVATAWLTIYTGHSVLGQTQSMRPMRLSIDARDLPRKLLHAKLQIPLTDDDQQNGRVALWYPKWVPGSHGPGGPIANLAGISFQTASGKSLSWKRTPGEVYRFEVDVPADVDVLHSSLHYIADQPTTTSFGHDCFGGSQLGVINPSSVLLCLEAADIDRQEIITDVVLPPNWSIATALPNTETSEGDSNDHSFGPVSLRTLVDSPLMFGKHYRAYNLVDAQHKDTIPPHILHVFGDESSHTDLDAEIIARLGSMVTQTAFLIGSHPYDQFDILLGVSDELPANGLEHARSTFNVLPPKGLQSIEDLKGWNRLLIPHEYLHAWCGKYRRPAGMLTSNFHTAKDTELLWVYEGLTQYLGELIEARSGLMSTDEFRHRLNVELRNAKHLQGRQWRTLADTAATSHILRDRSPSWSGLRRSQDYYMEGMLLWLEIDARIRQASGGSQSLDDFCASFLGSTSNDHHPKPFSRKQIVKALNKIVAYDWDGLIRRRVEAIQNDYDPAVAELLGYSFELTASEPEIPANTFRHSKGVDALDSLGILLAQDGTVKNVLLGSTADQVGLGPGMTVVGINGRKWSGGRFAEAIRLGQDKRPIELIVANRDELRTIQLHYHDGPRYWNLTRNEEKSDLLKPILAPK